MKKHLTVVSKQLPQKAILQWPWYRNLDMEKLAEKIAPIVIPQ